MARGPRQPQRRSAAAGARNLRPPALPLLHRKRFCRHAAAPGARPLRWPAGAHAPASAAGAEFCLLPCRCRAMRQQPRRAGTLAHSTADTPQPTPFVSSFLPSPPSWCTSWRTRAWRACGASRSRPPTSSPTPSWARLAPSRRCGAVPGLAWFRLAPAGYVVSCRVARRSAAPLAGRGVLCRHRSRAPLNTARLCLTRTAPPTRPPRPQLKSMVRSRSDLFDFSAAALVAGGATSMALFLAGLAASHGGAAPEVRSA